MGEAILVFLSGILFYVGFLARGIYPGDAGDVVTAAATFGIPHPPGYPLYTLLGFLLTRLPVVTPAWRVGLLSVVFHAATAACVYVLTKRLSGSRLIALFSTTLLIGNYIFFLYSVTPEVFAMLDAGVSAIILLAVTVKGQKRVNRWLIRGICLLLPLTILHHTMAILLVPSVFWLILPSLRLVKSLREWVLLALSFCIGLLPLLYIPVATLRGSSPILWDNPTTIARIIRLLTRADYGSFMSGSTVGHSLYERLLTVKSYGIFFLTDFTSIGVLFSILGLIVLWKRHRQIALPYLAALVLFGPAFSFYASFPIVNRFVLATVERFSLPSYVLLTPLIGLGVSFVVDAVTRIRKPLGLFVLLVLFVYPVSILGMNIWRFWGLSSDRTTDTFARALLTSAPDKALIFLQRDTPLFSAQYMRYAVEVRTDTVVLHTSRLSALDYREVVHNMHPDIILPQSGDGDSTYPLSVIKANRESRPIASNVRLPVETDGWTWVPNGLLFVLTKTAGAEPPTMDPDRMKKIWDSFGLPHTGMIGRYPHLFLTNVLDEYAILANDTGTYALTHQHPALAEQMFSRAIAYGSDTQAPTAWMYKGLSQSLLGNCSEALLSYRESAKNDSADTPTRTLFEAVTYRDCVGDETKANELFSLYGKQSTAPMEFLQNLPR